MEFATPSHSIGHQLSAVHRRVREDFPLIEGVGVALYDAKRDLLKTFVLSAGSPAPLARYDVPLTSAPSLLALAGSGEARVLDDLSFLASSPAPHPRRILEGGSRSSYTKPFFTDGRLVGFLFFNSDSPGTFDADTIDRLGVYAHLLSLVLLNGLESVHVVRSAVRLASELTRIRDAETGVHLERVSQYARLIARAHPPAPGLDDDFIEYLGTFAPAHDIGKVAIPDHILFKRESLTPAEFEIIKTHVTAGVALVESLIRDLDLDGFSHVTMLRSIVRSHHEVLDGSGYPDGLGGAEISLEARIVAVADVFDALTSGRPYKRAWTPEEAMLYLIERKGTLYDPTCVEAFESQWAAVKAIRARTPDRTS